MERDAFVLSVSPGLPKSFIKVCKLCAGPHENETLVKIRKAAEAIPGQHQDGGPGISKAKSKNSAVLGSLSQLPL